MNNRHHVGLVNMLRRGVREQCAVSGLHFFRDEMIVDSWGRLIHKKFEQRDMKRSKYSEGNGWKRDERAL